MRLNPISPSDNPMEKHLYCFGGGGDDSGGSDSGGSSRGTTTSSRGAAGGTRGRSRGNDSSRDSLGDSSISSGYGGFDRGGGGDNDRPSRATPAPAPAVNPGNIGVGSGASLGATSNQNFAARGPSTGGGSDRNFYADPAGAPSYPMAPDFSNTGAIAAPGFAPPSFSPTVDVADLTAMAEIQDALTADGRSDITSGAQTGTMDLSTMIDPSNQLDPFGDVISDEEHAANMAALQRTLAMPSLDISKPSPRATPAATGIAALGPVGTGQAYSGPARDAVDQSIDRAISDFAGQRVGRMQETQKDGTVRTEDFALSRDLVSLAPEFGAAYNPAEQQRMQEGTRAMPAFNIPDIPTPVGPIPASIAGRIASDLLKPESAVERALREGATPIPDAQGRIAGAVDANGNVYSNTPFGDIISGIQGDLAPGMQEAYDAQRAMQEEEMARSGGSDFVPIPAVTGEEDIFAPDVPEDYQGQDIVRTAPFTPRPAPTINYTGIPSLAPFTLRPTARPAPQAVDPFALLRTPRS